MEDVLEVLKAHGPGGAGGKGQLTVGVSKNAGVLQMKVRL